MDTHLELAGGSGSKNNPGCANNGLCLKGKEEEMGRLASFSNYGGGGESKRKGREASTSQAGILSLLGDLLRSP